MRIVGANEHNPRAPHRPAARSVHRRHRSLRLRQVDARLRHPLHRRAAPLPRQPVDLCAPVRQGAGAAQRRPRERHPAHRRDRAAPSEKDAEVDGRDGDRDLPLPAPALFKSSAFSTACAATIPSATAAKRDRRSCLRQQAPGAPTLPVAHPVVRGRKGFHLDVLRAARRLRPSRVSTAESSRLEPLFAIPEPPPDTSTVRSYFSWLVESTAQHQAWMRWVARGGAVISLSNVSSSLNWLAPPSLRRLL